MIKEQKIVDDLIEFVKKILNQTGFVKIIDIDSKKQGYAINKEAKKVDILIKVETNYQEQHLIFVEVKSSGEPRIARLAAYQIKDYIKNLKNSYGVLGAPFISKESAAICLQNGIGFIDLAGNCLFNFDNLYLSIQGKPNLNREIRLLRSIFTPVASRALRVMLVNPKREWLVQELSGEADMSLGQASNLKRKLLDNEYIKETEVIVKKGKRFKLSNPEGLLRKWVENYSYLKNNMRNFYSFDDPKTIEDKFARYCSDNNISYAFTLTSGASFVAPYLRYSRVFVYVKGMVDEIANKFDLKEVTTGANLSILEPYDKGILYGAQEFYHKEQIQGYKVVSDIQLYLDLKSYKERGDEAAEMIFEQRLKKQW